jgi:hypothetical protein
LPGGIHKIRKKFKEAEEVKEKRAKEQEGSLRTQKRAIKAELDCCLLISPFNRALSACSPSFCFIRERPLSCAEAKKIERNIFK